MVHGIHWIRPLASLNILYLHTDAPGAPYVSGVGILLVLSIALCGCSTKPFLSFINTRFSRLLVPWFWACALYTILLAFRGVEPLAWLKWPTILVGPYQHLWFLPAAFITNIVIYLILLFSPSLPNALNKATTSVLLILSSLLAWMDSYYSLSPLLILGFLLIPAFKLKQHDKFLSTSGWAFLTSSILYFLGVQCAIVYIWTGLFLLCMGIMLKFAPRLQAPLWWQKISIASYNVYLIHPFIQELLGSLIGFHPRYFDFITVSIIAYSIVLLWEHKNYLYQKIHISYDEQNYYLRKLKTK